MLHLQEAPETARQELHSCQTSAACRALLGGRLASHDPAEDCVLEVQVVGALEQDEELRSSASALHKVSDIAITMVALVTSTRTPSILPRAQTSSIHAILNASTSSRLQCQVLQAWEAVAVYTHLTQLWRTDADAEIRCKRCTIGYLGAIGSRA